MAKVVKELGPLAVSRLVSAGDHAVGGVAGLILRISATGARAWVLRVRAGERRIERGLGGFPTVSLGDARAKARAARESLALGVDPKTARAAARSALVSAKTGQETFATAATRYIAANSPGWRNAKHVQQWTNSLTTHAFPKLGSVPVAAISVADVLAVLRPIWSALPETAARLRQRIEKVIAAADAEHSRERLNPARLDAIGRVLPARKKTSTVRHFDSMPYAELPAFIVGLREQNGTAARALEWTILSGCRSHMTRFMTWSQLDLARGLWVVPAASMKVAKDWSSPLSPKMVALLPEQGAPDELVFPGQRKERPMSDATMAAVLKRMKVVGCTVHGFRATLKTWAAELTLHQHEVVELQLAHTVGDGVQQAYQRGDLLQKRVALLKDWYEFSYSIKRKPRKTS